MVDIYAYTPTYTRSPVDYLERAYNVKRARAAGYESKYTEGFKAEFENWMYKYVYSDRYQHPVILESEHGTTRIEYINTVGIIAEDHGLISKETATKLFWLMLESPIPLLIGSPAWMAKAAKYSWTAFKNILGWSVVLWRHGILDDAAKAFFKYVLVPVIKRVSPVAQKAGMFKAASEVDRFLEEFRKRVDDIRAKTNMRGKYKGYGRVDDITAKKMQTYFDDFYAKPPKANPAKPKVKPPVASAKSFDDVGNFLDGPVMDFVTASPTRATVTKTFVEAIETVVKTAKYSETVTFKVIEAFNDALNNVASEVKDVIEEQITRGMRDLIDDPFQKFNDLMETKEMPYIRKWVPFIRRRRRYGYRRYGRNSYGRGYTPRRRSYRRY